MADRGSRRRRAPRRALIGPLVMLAGGMAAGALLWRVLMLDEGRPGLGVPGEPGERLSHQDRESLERLLDQRGRP